MEQITHPFQIWISSTLSFDVWMLRPVKEENVIYFFGHQQPPAVTCIYLEAVSQVLLPASPNRPSSRHITVFAWQLYEARPLSKYINPNVVLEQSLKLIAQGRCSKFDRIWPKSCSAAETQAFFPIWTANCLFCCYSWCSRPHAAPANQINGMSRSTHGRQTTLP